MKRWQVTKRWLSGNLKGLKVVDTFYASNRPYKEGGIFKGIFGDAFEVLEVIKIANVRKGVEK